MLERYETGFKYIHPLENNSKVLTQKYIKKAMISAAVYGQRNFSVWYTI
jgi:hypothetical protein